MNWLYAGWPRPIGSGYAAAGPVSRWVAPQRGCCSVPRRPEEREQPGGAGGGASQGAAPAAHPDRFPSSLGVATESRSPSSGQRAMRGCRR
ncbi:hypothetical protein NN561_004528 [Cricetulus griseus]